MKSGYADVSGAFQVLFLDEEWERSATRAVGVGGGGSSNMESFILLLLKFYSTLKSFRNSSG